MLNVINISSFEKYLDISGKYGEFRNFSAMAFTVVMQNYHNVK